MLEAEPRRALVFLVPADYVGSNARCRVGSVVLTLQVPTDQIASDLCSASVLIDLDVSTHRIATAKGGSTSSAANQNETWVVLKLDVSMYP